MHHHCKYNSFWLPTFYHYSLYNNNPNIRPDSKPYWSTLTQIPHTPKHTLLNISLLSTPHSCLNSPTYHLNTIHPIDSTQLTPNIEIQPNYTLIDLLRVLFNLSLLQPNLFNSTITLEQSWGKHLGLIDNHHSNGFQNPPFHPLHIGQSSSFLSNSKIILLVTMATPSSHIKSDIVRVLGAFSFIQYFFL